MKKKTFNTIWIVIGTLILINIPWIVSQFTLNQGIKHSDTNYPEKDYQVEVSKLLDEKGVRHKIDQEGILKYNHRDKEIVDQIYAKLKRQHKPDWPNIYWANEEQRTELKNYLSNKQIPYKIRKLDGSGGDYILWPPEYDKEVQEIIKNTQ